MNYCLLSKSIRVVMATVVTAGVTGCGGPDLFSGNAQSSSGFGSGLGGNYGGGGYGGGGYGGSNYGGSAGGAGGRQGGGVRGRGTYAKIEASFELGDIKGDPFDYTENDVVVTISTQDGRSVKVPAFFDGGKLWKVRYTPDVSGRHTISNVSLNGKPVQTDKMDKKEFDATGTPQSGFVRRDSRDKTRFVLDNGNNYYPLGHNQPFGTGKSSELISRLEKMGRAGENWTRIWMTHYDGKSLDWTEKGKSEPGAYNLEAAKRWDEIIDAAEKNGIRIQIVLQHHGQYSTRVDAAWDANPWNKKNGGWMTTPDEFFTNMRAIGLTKSKYRYILARWGYSTSVLAWELFNEVENTDSSAHKHQDEIAGWHSGMAAFIRQNDPYKHLITTSADTQNVAMWRDLDFIQFHAYPSDPTVAATLDTRKFDKPVFYGEYGPTGIKEAEYGTWLHKALWSGIMSGTAGAVQPWEWEWIDKHDLYGQFKSASDFGRQSGYFGRHSLLSAAVSVDTKDKGPLEFGPGAGWAASKQTEFTVSNSGAIEGLANMPSFVQGSAHKEMFPAVSFRVNYPEAGIFKIQLAKVSGSGAHLVLSVDGATAAEKDFASTGKDVSLDTALEAKVSAGSHLIKLDNNGADWVSIKHFVLDPYAPTLQVTGRSAKDYAALWVASRTGKETAGKIALSGMQSGAYKVSWWDTDGGKTLSEDSVTVSGTAPLVLTTPAVTKDVAVYVSRSGEKSASKAPNPKKAKGT